MILCEVKDQAVQPTLVVRFRAPAQQLPHHLGQIYNSIIQYLDDLDDQAACGAFVAYHNMDLQNLELEAGFTLTHPLPGKDEIEASEIPAGMFALGHYTGPYEHLGAAYEELTRFTLSKGFIPSGVSYEFYLNGPETPPADLQTDILFPVTRTGVKATI